MGVKVSNNAFGTLSAGINTASTTVTLDAGQGARFPSLGAGDYFFATLVDTSNNLEIVKVTARSTDSMTVVRGQDDTTATAFAIGDRFELRPTAALFEAIQDEASVDGITSSAAGTAITIDSSDDVTVENDLQIDGDTTMGTSSVASRLSVHSDGVSTGTGTGYDTRFGFDRDDVGDIEILPEENGTASVPISHGITMKSRHDGFTQAALLFSQNGNDGTAAAIYTTNNYTGGPEQGLYISPTGDVLTPRQHAFHGVATNRLTCTVAGSFYTWTAWSTTVTSSGGFNRGGSFNTSNGRFTAPEDGVYVFIGSYLRNNNSLVFRGKFRINGTQVISGELRSTEAFAGYNLSSSHTRILQLNKNDYVEWGAECDTAGGQMYTSANGDYNYFAGYFLG